MRPGNRERTERFDRRRGGCDRPLPVSGDTRRRAQFARRAGCGRRLRGRRREPEIGCERGECRDGRCDGDAAHREHDGEENPAGDEHPRDGKRCCGHGSGSEGCTGRRRGRLCEGRREPPIIEERYADGCRRSGEHESRARARKESPVTQTVPPYQLEAESGRPEGRTGDCATKHKTPRL